MTEPRIGVVGKPDHEGVMVGRAFDLLGADVCYVDPWDDEGPDELLKQEPDLVLLSLEWVAKHRLVSAAAVRAGLPVVYVVDGVMEWSYVWNNHGFIRPNGTFLQPLLATDLSVIGRHQARILASWGLADRIRLVGLPRLDAVQRLETRVVGAARPRVLVATANTFGHDAEQRLMVRRALIDLAQWCATHDVVEPVWRIHPDLADDIGVTSDRTGTVIEAMASCAAVLSFPSTVVLEGMRLGIPVAQIDYRPVPFYVQSAWEIRHGEHIGPTLHDMLHPSPQRLTHQDHCLDDELEAGPASERLADVMRHAIARARAGAARASVTVPGATRDAPAAFGRLDYLQVHSQLSAFAVGPESRLQYELDATSQALDRLRARVRAQIDELAHAWDECARAREDAGRHAGDAEALRQARVRDEAARAARRAEYFSRGRAKLVRRVDRLAAEGVRQILVYGAGEVGVMAAAVCREAGLTVVAIADSNPTMWGQDLAGCRVVSPAAITRLRVDAVVVGSFSHAAAIRRRVRTALGPKRRLPVVGVTQLA